MKNLSVILIVVYCLACQDSGSSLKSLAYEESEWDKSERQYIEENGWVSMTFIDSCMRMPQKQKAEFPMLLDSSSWLECRFFSLPKESTTSVNITDSGSILCAQASLKIVETRMRLNLEFKTTTDSEGLYQIELRGDNQLLETKSLMGVDTLPIWIEAKYEVEKTWYERVETGC